jgi:two-component system KDP operon response regulator KdpE
LPPSRVLIVDDEPEVRAVLRDYLHDQGYDVGEAETAIGALTEVKERRPDVVLLDLNMPGAVRGEAIIAALRAQEIPVIIISGEHDADVARLTLREGAFDYVKKPFDLLRVRDLVEAALLF